MSTFMLLFRMDGAAVSSAPSADEMQAMLDTWQQWIGGIASQGKLISTQQLKPGGKVVSNGGALVTDGPYIELKELLGGYLIASADSLDEAVTLAQGCPILHVGGNVEVREIFGRD